MRPAYFVFCLALGIGIGFFLGRWSVFEDAGGLTATHHSQTVAATADGTATLEDAAPRQRTESGERSRPQPLSEMEVLSSVENLQSGTLSGAESSRAWAELWERLRVSDLPVLAAALSVGNADKENRTLASVMAVWSEQDPEKAWSFAQSLESVQTRRNTMFWVLGTWARQDHAAALMKLREVKDELLRRQLMSRVMTTLAQKDPAKAFEIAVQDGDSSEPSMVSAILRQWLRKDPLAARDAASKLRGHVAREASAGIVEELSRSDPRAAWDYVQGLPREAEPDSFRDLQARVVELWAQSDPAMAITAALTITDLAKRDNAIMSAIYAWSSADFDAAVNYAVTALEPGVKAKVLQGLARRQNVPHETVFNALLEHVPTSAVFKDSVAMLMKRWARTDPQAAATAALRLSPRDGLSGAVAAVIGEWADSSTSRQQVLNWAVSLPEGAVRDAALKEAFQRWAAQDPATAQQLLSTSGATTNKQVIEGLVTGWIRANPGEAARWVLSLPENLRPSGALRDAVRSWTQSSPTDAATFVQSIPASLRPDAAEILIQMWSSRDPAAAAGWVKAQPAGPAKDVGISTIVEVIADDDPESALAWTRSMANEQARLDRTESILRSWMRDDPARAKAWMATAQITEALRKKLSADP